MQYSEGFLLDGRYSLKQYIGSGSFGEVWLARDCETDVDIAVKIYISMDNQGLEDFRKEFQLSFELNHTNLLHASYLGVNSDDSRPYLVMPFCPDGSVTKFAGKMDEKTLWRFVRDVAAGLAYLHSQTPEILHQDIKPDNILIMKNGDFVISDFGISKQLKQTLRRSARITDTAGAISYMGPERYGSNPIAVKATDIWAFGISIFEMATGELPFCGQGGIMLKNGAEMPELPQEFSRQLNYVMTSCLSKDTWDRPTAGQVAKYAQSMLDGEKPVPFNENAETSVEEGEKSQKNDGRKTVRQIDPSKAQNFKSTVRESAADKSKSGTVRERVLENGTQMETSESSDGRTERKKNKLLFPILAVVVVVAAVVVILIHNRNVKEQERLDSIGRQNSELVGQINSALRLANAAKIEGDDITKEERHKPYLNAYRYILEADSLSGKINKEVRCDVPDFLDLKQSVKDSLFYLSTLMKGNADTFLSMRDTTLAKMFTDQAREIDYLIGK